ncbi:Core-2/I-branching beta-1,6-N-acetylglucosaminyltransferase family protein [Melia azedarach]|uniref:Core-2/I-branching beta-1,6-N-acetylglucosaminyltransferase family protein n=1 Tax=Melia azedarach TaxID=155640 RepID=A0ACC1Y255_MELAZ|nr:Core-2/I-branching beta-1,6-N-acetylglucosaminyltransferase family protein [Melia azedarach]
MWEKKMGRNRGEKEETEKYIGLLKLVQILSFLVVFVAGIIIGLATSSHMNQYFTPSLLLSTNHFSGLSFESNNCSKNCEENAYLHFEKFFHPENLRHRMSDEQLFWRASMVPSKEEYPVVRTPKLAFMFLTRGPLPLLPLWERFFKGHEEYFSIYVHALPGYKLNVSKDSPFYGRQIPSQNVAWGTVEMADAEKRLLANALLDFSNERFILLSESCIPVFNFPTVYKYLSGSEHSFVESYDDPSRYGRGRYNRRMRPDIKVYQWRKGSQWFEMHRKVAIYIISDTKYLTIFRKYCRPSCYPDEHYIPTYLNIFHPSLMANRTVTWVNWSVLGPHPAMYRKENITEDFIQSIRNSNGTLCLYNEERTSKCYLFARKFAPDALEPLLNMSSKVMEF